MFMLFGTRAIRVIAVLSALSNATAPGVAQAQETLTFPARASNLPDGAYWTLTEFGEGCCTLDLNVQKWDGNSWEGGSGNSDNSDSFDWNVPIYAPANGVIASCWQHSPDNPAGEILSSVMNTANAGNGVTKTIFRGGNHVVILTDEGNAISLNHFKEGSVPDNLCPSNNDGTVDVPTMDSIGSFRTAAFIDAADRPRVTEGQLVGRVGNSGNSGGPHLHMSISPVQSVNATTGAITLGTSQPFRIRNAWAHGFQGGTNVSAEGWFRYRGNELSENHSPKNKIILASPYLRRASVGAGMVKPAMDVAFLNSLRAVTATISDETGEAKLIVWDTIGTETLNRKGSFDLGAAKDIRIGLASSESFLVAVRQADDNLKVIAFQVTPTGGLLRRDDELAGEITALDMTTTLGSGKRAVTAVRDGAGKLRIIAWNKRFVDGELLVERMGQAVGPEISALAVASAGNFTGVLTAVRVDGSLRVIPWRMTGAGTGFDQGNAGTAGQVGPNLGVARLAQGAAASVVDGQGRLRIITWTTTTGGDIDGPRKGTLTAHESLQQTLLQSPAAGSNLTSVMRGSDGLLYLIGWAADGDGGNLRRLGTSKAGAIGGLAADSVIRSFPGLDPREFTLTAVSDSAGDLKLLSWDTNLEIP